jgi:hypothetical protein
MFVTHYKNYPDFYPIYNAREGREISKCLKEAFFE